MRDTIILFRLLAPFAILAGCVLALPMYAWYLAEIDVQAGNLIIKQKSEEAEIAVQWAEDKGLLKRTRNRKIKLSMPIKKRSAR